MQVVPLVCEIKMDWTTSNCGPLRRHLHLVCDWSRINTSFNALCGYKRKLRANYTNSLYSMRRNNTLESGKWGGEVTFRRDMTVGELYKWTAKWAKAARKVEKLERGQVFKINKHTKYISHEQGIWLQTEPYTSYAPIGLVWLMVLNATFNNISVISWW